MVRYLSIKTFVSDIINYIFVDYQILTDGKLLIRRKGINFVMTVFAALDIVAPSEQKGVSGIFNVMKIRAKMGSYQR